MNISCEWNDYTCIASGDGEKLEKWGNYILRRPDPQIIWPKTDKNLWDNWDGFYHRSNKGGGYWEFKKKLPDSWTIKYKNLKFKVSPTNFKHTCIFSVPGYKLDFVANQIKNSGRKDFRVLNLFAYTGCATISASAAGASEVVHVDSSKGMIEWAKENRDLSGIHDNYIRYIIDDVMKFLAREKRRGRTYHCIIMDPPSYGRGPNGEVWKLEDNLGELLKKAKDVLDDDYSFLLINSYTTGISPTSLNNILSLIFNSDNIVTGEIGLPVKENNLVLPCGIYGKVTKN